MLKYEKTCCIHFVEQDPLYHATIRSLVDQHTTFACQRFATINDLLRYVYLEPTIVVLNKDFVSEACEDVYERIRDLSTKVQLIFISNNSDEDQSLCGFNTPIIKKDKFFRINLTNALHGAWGDSNFTDNVFLATNDPSMVMEDCYQ